MYTLLSGLYKHLNQKSEYSILLLGLDNAGKTACSLFDFSGASNESAQTLLEQLKATFAGTAPRPASSIAPTVGLNGAPAHSSLLRISPCL